MKGFSKVLIAAGSVAGIAVAGVAMAKARARQGTEVGGGNIGVRGASGVEWLLTPTGQQVGPAFGTMAWVAHAAPGTKFLADNGSSTTLASLTPVVQFLQVGADTRTRTLVSSYIAGKGMTDLQTKAISDLGIKTA